MVKRLLRGHKSLTHTKLGGAPLQDTYCITPGPRLEFDWISTRTRLVVDWTSYLTYGASLLDLYGSPRALLMHLYCSSTRRLLVLDGTSSAPLLELH